MRDVLGDKYQGTLVSDCFGLRQPTLGQGQVPGHIIHDLSELLATKKGTARAFLRESLELFRRAWSGGSKASCCAP